jgi:hypothetical protein
VLPISLILFLLRGPIVALFDAEGVTVNWSSSSAARWRWRSSSMDAVRVERGVQQSGPSLHLNRAELGSSHVGTILPVILFAGVWRVRRFDRSGRGGRSVRPLVSVAGAAVMIREVSAAAVDAFQGQTRAMTLLHHRR